MSSSSSGPPDAHVAGANRVPPQPQRKYEKQKATGAAIALAEGAIQPGNCADVAVAAETVCGVVGKSSWTKKNSTTKDGTRTLHLRCMSEKPPEKGAKSPGRCQFECNCIEGDKRTPQGKCESSSTLVTTGVPRAMAASVLLHWAFVVPNAKHLMPLFPLLIVAAAAWRNCRRFSNDSVCMSARHFRRQIVIRQILNLKTLNLEFKFLMMRQILGI